MEKSLTQVRNEMRETFTTELEALQAQRSQLENTLVSHNWVLGIPNNGENPALGATYMTTIQEGPVVTAVRMTTLSQAPRFTKEDAEALCANGNIRNGAGHTARPVQIRQALAWQIAEIQSLLQMLEAVGIPEEVSNG